nr:MAG TPA: hypothetical protein [Caudoviricetes sp.]
MVKRLCIIIHVCIFAHVKLRLLYSAACRCSMKIIVQLTITKAF